MGLGVLVFRVLECKPKKGKMSYGVKTALVQMGNPKKAKML